MATAAGFIAAAPDLLAACQAALSRLTEDERCLDCAVRVYEFAGGHAFGCIVPELEAAIWKVTGQR